MSYYNFDNSNLTNEAQNCIISAQDSYPNRPDTSNQASGVNWSTLEPTAQEFHPLGQSVSLGNGAVKKKPWQFRPNKNKYKDNGREKQNKYGSGRIFSGHRNTYIDKNERSVEEYSQTSQDNTGFLKSSNYGNFDESSRQSNFSFNKSSNRNKNSEQHSSKNASYQSYQNGHYDNLRNKYSTNIGGTFEQLRGTVDSEENLSPYENSNRHYKNHGRIYGKSNKTSGDDTFESSNHYEKKNKYFGKFFGNSTIHKERNNNSSGKNNYVSDRNSDNDEMSDRNMSINYLNKINFSERKENVNSYRSGFKNFGYSSRNKHNEGRTQKDWGKPTMYKNPNHIQSNKKLHAASQRERLEEMLNCRLLECLVCCEKIKNTDKVWSCVQCYHILHLNCIAEWAKSSKVENGWRCPACQNVCTDVPNQYKCYCGKTIEPKCDPSIVPHGCGDMCLKKGRSCDHKCSILCHPGPCPDCTVMVPKSCGCGSTQQIVKCSTDLEIVCDSICNKSLECGIHKCKAVCHSGTCSPCNKKIVQECYCGKVGRKVACKIEYNGETQYSCEEICGKLLSCGNHKCQKTCHSGPCETCSRDVSQVHSCPCGKTPLDKLRVSCLDPIPCCNKICGKLLQCGQPSCPHTCKEKCHEGVCPPCPLTTIVRCRCGHMDKELPCRKLTTKADDARCEKKCIKKRLCGKHRCNQRCCIEIEHFCPLPCNHQLTCGQHRCLRTCHSGRCPPCMETSFEELYCECGTSVLFPPVPCGTKPPACSQPCSRPRHCEHDVNHNCHTGPCPPCTVLSKRWCHGHHEQRSAIPCHQENFSCGLPCGKDMPCGRHKCNKPCHDGPCPSPCKQPCTIPRNLCGHPCGKPCHDPPCSESICKQNVPVTCLCGLQKSTKPCVEVAEEFKNIEMAQLKEKIGTFSKDQSVDISDIINNPKKPTVLKILECTEECRVTERNRRLAIGLQIRNPDLSQKLLPRYTDYMKQWAKKDPHFCQRIHDKLTELVQLAKQSKQKSRSYSFESMNRDKRHFIHEYCEHFGVESAAYDMEPNRNIVATAIKDKSWLPSMSLLEVIQRENGQRKVPGPVSVLSKSPNSKSEAVSLKLPSRIQRPNTPPREFVDYFDPPPF